jgi:hypothetical protein
MLPTKGRFCFSQNALICLCVFNVGIVFVDADRCLYSELCCCVDHMRSMSLIPDMEGSATIKTMSTPLRGGNHRGNLFREIRR